MFKAPANPKPGDIFNSRNEKQTVSLIGNVTDINGETNEFKISP